MSMSGCADESCGFEDWVYRVTFEPLQTGCEPEPDAYVRFSEPYVPQFCSQHIAYDQCDPVVQRQCNVGKTRGLWVLHVDDTKRNDYIGQLQVVSTATQTPYSCDYRVTLDSMP